MAERFKRCGGGRSRRAAEAVVLVDGGWAEAIYVMLLISSAFTRTRSLFCSKYYPVFIF